MELKVDIGFDELLHAIKQLPADKIDKLKAELTLGISAVEYPEQSTDFRQLLLNGPVMDDDQFKLFKETRKRLNKWRTK